MEKHWIPSELRGTHTFFSDYDLWQYHTMQDDRVCEVCSRHAHMAVVIGSKIRLLFPYLDIISVDVIAVNEHMPRDANCRCWLTRIGFFEFTLGKEKKRGSEGES